MRHQETGYTCKYHGRFTARVPCHPGKAPCEHICPQCGLPSDRARPRRRGNVSVTDACKRALKAYCVANGRSMSGLVEELMASVGVP